MANPLPGLRGTGFSGYPPIQALYPITYVLSTDTNVSIFTDASEQRWVRRAPLAHFVLPMSSIDESDKAAWLTHFSTALGQASQTLSLTIGSNTYENLTLLSDDLAVTTNSPLYYHQQITLRQVQNPTFTAPTSGSAFPTLSSGCVAQFPFEQTSSFLTSVVDQPTGPRYVYAWYGAGHSGLPTGYLRAWKLEYPLLSDADMLTLQTFFTNQQGRYVSFDFTDPLDNTTYHHVRFDQDDLEIQYLAPNNNSTTLLLRQTNGS